METEREYDLALAAELQAALLPKFYPECWPHKSVAARYRMCSSVGGDFYDFIHINAQQFAVAIGDVVGHGVRAAMMMAQITGYLRAEPARRGRPVQVVRELNEMLIELADRTGCVMPCSLLYAVIDVPSGIGFFVNAGHPRPYLISRKTTATLHFGDHNILLGVQAFEPEESCHTFVAGERIVMYTDGITESQDDHGEYFGERRLHDLISACSACDPGRCADGIFEAVEQFRGNAPQKDDETILIIDRA